ncbi:MAG TPA: GH32 C-terminal domain-containing protein, partial [Segetibacter sp.]|nr:GH32 C-terminal domain-containing protein [Segetibacter sp.]
KKWVLYAADGKYKIGNFDGKKFTEEQNLRTYDNGGTAMFYASQTYNNIPANDGRRIQIGWARINIDSMPFNQCMAFPTELKLKKAFDGYRLCPTPVTEIKTLYKDSHKYSDIVLIEDSIGFRAPVKGDVLHVLAKFERGDSREFGLNINGYELSYNNLFNEFNKINYPIEDKKILKIEAIVDKAIAEVFVNDGELYFVRPLNSVMAEKQVKAFARGFNSEYKSILKKLEIHELNSIWLENR